MTNLFKKFFCLVSIFILIFQNVSVLFASAPKNNEQDEFRGVWISFLDFKDLAYQKTEQQFIDKINKAFDNIKSMNFTDVIVQVRPFSDALYKSSIFPVSHILTGTQGVDCGYDPLSIMIEKAHEKNLKFHAWVNLYRIQNPGQSFEICESHPAKKWLDEINTDEIVKLSNGGIYYNPASVNAQNLIISGIEEIVKNYNIDSIQFDDYFYPTTSEEIDRNYYDKYKKTTQDKVLSLEAWRLQNVNNLVKKIYSQVKKIKSNVLVGISPSGNIDFDYKSMFADVKEWLSEPGYIDYLIPQIYYGFENQKLGFHKTLKQWADIKKLDNIKLYVGLAFYKINSLDKFALSGQNEWIENHNIISKQILESRSNNEYQGFALFRYDFIFNPSVENKEAVETELFNIKSILKN